MDVIRATPFEFGTVVWPLRPGTPLMLLVVKATYDLRPDAYATIRPEQTTCTGPLFDDDDPDRSLRYPGDFDPLKPQGECFLSGTCHPPGGTARACEIRFEVGAVKKSVAVFGDRRWKGGLLGGVTEPEPFTAMPLAWERAFGGPGFAPNPFGRGAAPVETGEGPVHPLPNLEDPRRLVDAKGARPTPAGFFPIHPASPSRLRFAGTYGTAWTEERFPFFPVDLDPAYFLWSPEDQRAPGYWTGSEIIGLGHLHPEHPYVKCQLPGIRPRAFVVREGDATETLHEVSLKCDTIVVDADALTASCIHRGLFPVADPQASDVRSLFMLHEKAGEELSVEACHDRFEAQLRLIALEEGGFEPLDPSDDEDARTIARVLERAESLAPSSERAHTFAGVLMTLAEGSAFTMIESADAASTDAASTDAASTDAASTDAANLDAPPAETSVAGLDAGRPDFVPPESAEPAPGVSRATIATSFDAIGEAVPGDLDAKLEDLAPESLRDRALLAYAEGRAWTGDLTGLALPEESLDDLVAERAILDGADLGGASLRAAQLAGASLTGARLAGADLSGADLSGADLTRASLEGAKLDDATLDGAVLEGAKLDGATLAGASLTKAEARGASFRGALLEGVDATELDLTRGSLREARCRGARFTDARFAGVDARFADLSSCNLEKLRGYDGAHFDGADLREASADGSRFGGSSLANADLSFGRFERANFTAAILREARLDGCRLKKAKLRGADLTRALVRKSDLMQAKLGGAILSETDLRGSNLFAAELHEAILDRPRLDLANLEGTKREGRS